ncbi:zinc metalloprotease HtpX [Poriferisphaera sp. WC338]|uniref:zinc metalloprotease HtpX n=1 Tax=Poriferisphaera sp. WC338 TaxID=3425129 RepID=UPI003D816822
MTAFTNNVKTAILLGAMFALIMGIGALVGGYSGLAIAFIIALVMNFGAFFYSDKIAIASMHGQPADPRVHGDIITMVERLAKNANLPMPRVFVCPQQAPNAFATGRSPSKAAVAVTQGALNLLTYDELEGVMAHELAHVKNRDTLTSTIAATIAGAISFLAWMVMWQRDIHPLIKIGLWLLAPIAAGIIQMAISRSREFVADHDGAQIAGSPHGLISALQKLEAQAARVPLQGETPAQNHMFIVQPLSPTKALANMFRTHPQTADRVAKLRQMA